MTTVGRGTLEEREKGHRAYKGNRVTVEPATSPSPGRGIPIGGRGSSGLGIRDRQKGLKERKTDQTFPDVVASNRGRERG